jgi:PAS domain S-box-containing protein
VTATGPQGTVRMDPQTHHAAVNTFLSRCNAEGAFDIVEHFGTIEPKSPDRYRHQRIDGATELGRDARLVARMVEQMSEAVLLIEPNNLTILVANPAATRLLGDGDEPVVGSTVSIDAGNMPTPGDGMALLGLLRRQGHWNGELAMRSRGGTPFWCSASFSAFTHPEQGEVWFAVLRDITERRESEQALRASEERLRLVLDATNDGIWD